MLYMSDEAKKVLSNKVKAGAIKPTIRIELDKYVYDPSMSIKLAYKDYYDIMEGEKSGKELCVTNETNISSSTVMCSPLLGVPINSLHVNFGFWEKYGSSAPNITREQAFAKYSFMYKGGPHQGVDLRANAGDKVVAVSTGTVVDVHGIGGRTAYIVIKHENDIHTIYMHIRSTKVEKGDKVDQGNTICEIYDLGAGATHLHFEVVTDYSKGYMYAIRQNPMTFLKDDGNRIMNTEVVDYIPLRDGVIKRNAASVRASTSPGSTILATLDLNTYVSVDKKQDDFFHITSPAGWVQSAFIAVSTPQESNPERPDGNPSYRQIVDCISNKCAELGMPVEIGLATAWTESDMTHYGVGGGVLHHGDDWGIMQINDISHAAQFPRVQNDWKYNCEYGVSYLNEHYIKAKKLGEENIARATYCGYNSGSWYSRYRTYRDPYGQDHHQQDENHNGYDDRDENFFNYYTTQPWNSKISSTSSPIAKGTGTVTTSSTPGSVTSSTGMTMSVPIKKTALDSAETIQYVSSGYILEEYSAEGDWFKVRLGDGSYGYINKVNYRQNNFPVSMDYEIREMIHEDFSNGRPNNFMVMPVLTSSPSWSVVNKELTVHGSGEKCSVSFSTGYIISTGRLNISIKHSLSVGCFFLLYINNKIVYSGIGVKNLFNNMSFILGSGSHIIRLERTKSEGENSITLDDVKVVQFVMRPERIFNRDMLATQIDSESPVNFSITAVEADVYTSKSKTTVIKRLPRGSKEEIDGDLTDDGWVKLKLEDGATGYVESELGTWTTGDTVHRTLYSNTGGFRYEKTITVTDILSANIDRRYDLRAAEATFVIDNTKGYRSPDFRSGNVNGNLIKSDYTDYYNDYIIGLLGENTPVKIYLGYGDHVVRRFTGLIDSVSVDGEAGTISIKCTDMMKKINQFVTNSTINYPPDSLATIDGKAIAFLTSSIIEDLVRKSGLTSWRETTDDFQYLDYEIEESYVSDITPKNGQIMRYDENEQAVMVDIKSLPEGALFKTPAYTTLSVPVGTNVGDKLQELCDQLNQWQRCDFFGTYRCVTYKIETEPLIYLKDNEDIITVNKTFDYSVVRNHVIIMDSEGNVEHFFDRALWIMAKGVLKTCKIEAPWANEYGQKYVVAQKLFNDMKMACTTVQAVTEGHPYLDLLDCIAIQHEGSATSDAFTIKSIQDIWSEDGSYTTSLDLSFVRRV
jgi:biotin carboxyl carrier protein